MLTLHSKAYITFEILAVKLQILLDWKVGPSLADGRNERAVLAVPFVCVPKRTSVVRNDGSAAHEGLAHRLVPCPLSVD